MTNFLAHICNLFNHNGVVDSTDALAVSEATETVISKVQRVISVPPKPKGVQEVVTGDGDEVIYTEEGCLKQPEQFQDICFHQLARQKALTDLVGASEMCQRVQTKDMVWECLADVAELYSPVDRDVAFGTLSQY